MVYQFKPGARLSTTRLSAQAIGERLETIRERDGGLTAQAVVDDAKPKKSPMHGAFEWNDTKAAEEYRREQARHLLSAITVKLVGKDEAETVTRAFVVVTPAEGGNDIYTSTEVALADPDMRQQVLGRAWRELSSWQRKYQELKELAGVFGAIETARPLFEAQEDTSVNTAA